MLLLFVCLCLVCCLLVCVCVCVGGGGGASTRPRPLAFSFFFSPLLVSDNYFSLGCVRTSHDTELSSLLEEFFFFFLHLAGSEPQAVQDQRQAMHGEVRA